MNCWYRGTLGGAEASGLERKAAAAIEKTEQRVKVRIKTSVRKVPGPGDEGV
jgi:hypothetical protein